MPDRLIEILDRVADLPPGPWTVAADLGGTVWIIDAEGNTVDGQAFLDFIAAARTDIPFLLERITELTHSRDWHQEQFVELKRSHDACITPDIYAAAARAIRQDLDEARARLDAVRARHKPLRIFDECKHEHNETGPGIYDIEEVGLVCEDGYVYPICRECCCDGGDYQTEVCVDGHDHAPGDEFLCDTMRDLDGKSTKDGA